MRKISKVIFSEDSECDGCKYEYRDRTGKPCVLCNRNYELYSDRFEPDHDDDDECVDGSCELPFDDISEHEDDEDLSDGWV